MTGCSAPHAVLFDLMGVLLFLRKDWPGEKAVDAVDDMIGGVTDDNAFRTSVRVRFGIGEVEFQKILARIPEKYEAYPPLWNLLPALRKKCKLGIINNGTRLTFPYFDAKFNFSEQFDAVLSSGAEGLRKPEKEIYLRAADRLGVDPGRCLFLDDSKANIQGAERAGMQAVFGGSRDKGFAEFSKRMRV
ncbi:MAG: HAD-IA family hydrolase [Anaerolineales bacterium]|nr:HAD-IA family hydrolase [Anaerolineales bacterium]